MQQTPEVAQEVKTPDGRVLTFEVTGSPHGSPVFLLHGTPGSRSGPKPRSSVLYRQGVRLICYDRPGYGGSSPDPGREVARSADDIACIAESLGIERFAVVGRSGGGPHALACAALLPGHVTRAAALVSVAPADADGLDWYSGMAEDNVKKYSTIESDAARLIEGLRLRADLTRSNPERLIENLLTEMTEADRHVVKDFSIRRQLTDTYQEALRLGPYGWIDDVFAFRKSWGFRLADIRPPVLLWHGAEDNFSPPRHSRWLAANIPNATIRVQKRTAHFGAVEALPEILSWLLAADNAMVSTADRTVG